LVWSLVSSNGSNTSPGSAASAPLDVIPAASCAQTDVQAAIDLAQEGDTVQAPAGNCTWTTVEPRTPAVEIAGKAITLQGAGIGKTIITP
jgi:uncharacterized Zn-binding protein involved in type VI secretion